MNANVDPAAQAVNAAPSRKLADLGVRIASAIVMAALALGALWAGGWLFAAFWTVAGIAMLWEWQHLIGGEALKLRIGVGAGALALVAGLGSLGHVEAAMVVIAAAALAVAWLARGEGAVWAGAGVVYAAAMILAICILRASLFYGFVATLWVFAVVWTADVMAYFGGRLIGGPKLCPRISPAKTVSGFLVGVTCAAIVSCAIALWLTTPGEASAIPLLALGVVAAAISQGGDLFESFVKRRFGAKDSSRIIPGHGGVMDRLDAFVFASVFAVIVGSLHKGTVAAAHGLLVW